MVSQLLSGMLSWLPFTSATKPEQVKEKKPAQYEPPEVRAKNLFKEIHQVVVTLPPEINQIIAAYAFERDPEEIDLTIMIRHGKPFVVTARSTKTVSALKLLIFQNGGPRPERQNLMVMGKLLQPGTRVLNEYNLRSGDKVFISSGTRG